MKKKIFRDYLIYIVIIIALMFPAYCITCVTHAKSANVLIETKDYDGYGIGSGVVISENGLIVTAKHVVEGCEYIRITLSDSRVFEPNDIRIDDDSDLAIINLHCKTRNFVKIKLSKGLRYLHLVFGIGNSEGIFDSDYSFGWIYKCPYRRMFLDDSQMIMLGMKIYPGCSGGGIYRFDKLIGIMIAASDDYCFALSSEEILDFLKECNYAI